MVQMNVADKGHEHGVGSQCRNKIAKGGIHVRIRPAVEACGRALQKMRVRHSQACMGGAGFGATGIGYLTIEAVGARARVNSDMHLCAATGPSTDRAANPPPLT